MIAPIPVAANVDPAGINKPFRVFSPFMIASYTPVTNIGIPATIPPMAAPISPVLIVPPPAVIALATALPLNALKISCPIPFPITPAPTVPPKPLRMISPKLKLLSLSSMASLMALNSIEKLAAVRITPAEIVSGMERPFFPSVLSAIIPFRKSFDNFHASSAIPIVAISPRISFRLSLTKETSGSSFFFHSSICVVTAFFRKSYPGKSKPRSPPPTPAPLPLPP